MSYCDDCTFECTAPNDGKCAKTEDTLRQLRSGQGTGQQQAAV